MKNFSQARYLSAALLVAAFSQPALGQNAPTPPPGYFDIPAGFDFPADKRLLEQYRSQPNVAAQRLHACNVFAGMTQPTTNGNLVVFETWFSEPDTFDKSTALAAARTQSSARTFSVPRQFTPLKARPGVAAPEPGSAVLSAVLYNFAAYNHIRSNRLHIPSVLADLAKNGAFDAKIPQNRTVPPFPPGAVVLKTVWWPVARDKVSAMPIWDPEANPAMPPGNPKESWARFVGVDATRLYVPSGETADITYDGQVKRGAHVVGLSSFHAIKLTAEMAANINKSGSLTKVAQASFGRPPAADDFVVLVATHLTTKEIDDWVWATFWWHDRAQEGPFAANRVGSLEGVWKNYLMNVSYDLNLPGERDGSPRIAFNPWLEARFPFGGHGMSGTVSNCMNCHNRASTGADDFLPIYRGNPDFAGDTAYAPGSLRGDFLWSVVSSHDN
jgi:hypothetical protein